MHYILRAESGYGVHRGDFQSFVFANYYLQEVQEVYGCHPYVKWLATLLFLLFVVITKKVDSQIPSSIASGKQ